MDWKNRLSFSVGIIVMLGVIGRNTVLSWSGSSRTRANTFFCRHKLVRMMAIGEADVNLSKNSNRPVVICGPSGVGVSHTTRQPRVGEVNGIHYHFTTVDQMKKDIDNGLFLEHANVHGNLYGTSKKAVQDVAEKGKICILDIDVQGVQNTKKYDDFEATYIFIAPPSFETLKERLIGRGTESAETLRKRTENARIELEYGMKEGNFHHIIVNDIVENARSELQSILGEIYSL